MPDRPATPTTATPSDLASAPRVQLTGARQNNLKNIDVSFPRAALTVVTGVSGSGKSSLAFDTIYAEGQRRYVECVSTYAKQFLDRLPRPEYDRLEGLAPAVAIRQGAAAQTGRSTVATVTELADYLRLLLARVGETRCGRCGHAVPRHSLDSVLEAVLRGATPPDAADHALIAADAASPADQDVSIWILFGGADEDPAALWARALQRGFLRARRKGTEAWLRLDEPPPAKLKGPIELLIDRTRATLENRMRVREALEHAWREGDGRVTVERASGERSTYADGRVCESCGRTFPEPRPQLFSFNSPYGACPECRGFGNVLTFTLERVVPHPEKSVNEGALDPWKNSWKAYFTPKVQAVAEKHRIPLNKPFKSLKPEHQQILLHGEPGFRGVFPFLERLKEKAYKAGNRFLVKHYQEQIICGTCRGLRLKPEAMEVYVGGKNVADLTSMTIGAMRAFMAGLELDPVRSEVAAPILAELRGRLEYLGEVGLDYLTLDRATKTLSGGEAQRIDLANALGGSLSHALYVLDEPTVGLHARDTDRLIHVMQRLRARGNTLLVVEHDPDVIESADWIIELGPGAGERGGQNLFEGPIASWPGRRAHVDLPVRDARFRLPDPKKSAGWIEVRGAREHNLKNVTARIPIGALTSVCGVSGSGKSTLIEDVLYRAAARAVGETGIPAPGAHDEVTGLEGFSRIVLVDQSPVGRTLRSNPATFVKAFDRIRERWARAPLARERKYTPGTFSFNVAGGRCDVCEGAGVTKVEMYFLADLWVPCEACQGRRYRADVLEVKVHGLSMDALLDLTVDEALRVFSGEPEIQEPLWILERVGLGYLRLGQPLTTLSGGETQRLKLARELADRSAPDTLYLLDEPTVGLHRRDVAVLLRVLHELTRRGGTVVAVEHNLDFLASSDWLIELGPDGGDGGGRVVATGTPTRLQQDGETATADYLRKRTTWA